MDLFARINGVYATFFGTSPPARACVAVDLPHPRRVKIDCIAFADESLADRQALHVQSLSYWAPANIGPYSQAIVVRVFLAGLRVSLMYYLSLMKGYSYQGKLDSFP